ncbi:energy-coupled thiamine transporter ThiT, partial [Romboutsia sp.]|uniref:energy-coupled thiamine transporter ThiT n=1 Tax=Romboutsia sp. TaxID=1965302 RepID=UPI003F3532A3
TKFTTKKIVAIGMFSGIAFILSMIQFIQYPQGGGIALLSMMPVMLVSLLYGKGEGLTAGLVYGGLKLLNGAYVVHPVQLILDYILANIVLGFAGSFGREKKSHAILGCLMASMLSVACSVLSGVVFFGEYAPKGMNVWLYSFLYNFSSVGVEGILCSITIAFMPLARIAKEAKLNNEVRIDNKPVQ